ncbi:elongation factor Ts [Mycoplasmoides fastidiosum]|uniref:Elongation factor Ts n=1 Tax=Mycoplasmoides fastidiosum TaxID=92758 RepID=A0ABU0LZQ8_9BACT|nr:translation elongation factor Ts [Mycoplasmoides fastidiosum]MDQ0514193.1 elongation factor Ts [Mycoplasmoides fastidiosum]UUD37397.1 translation elongation factor Ts [Mycoplasmoides fastidiosum]
MNSVTNLLKELRNATQAGFMDCKKALEATAEEITKLGKGAKEHLELAIKWLRENGMAKAANKNAAKVAAEGLALAAADEKGVALFELNTQTDFTAASADVVKLAEQILAAMLSAKVSSLEEVKDLKLADGHTVNEECLELSSKTGEKIELRRVIYYSLQPNQSVGLYVHNNKKIASFIVFENTADAEKLKGMAMHLTAMDPRFLDETQVDQQWLNNEKAILESQLAQEGKPKEFAGKIIEGRIKKLLAEVCLVSQPYILDDAKTVGEYAQSLNVKPVLMHRFKVGDGIEVAEVDFASEVAAQMRK